MLLSGGGSTQVATACALLSERHFLPPHGTTTTSDVLSAVEQEQSLPPHVTRVARDLQRLVQGDVDDRRPNQAESRFLRAVLEGYPDRVAKRRAPGSARLLLASGHGAVQLPQSGVRESEFVVAIDVQAGRRGEGAEARVRMASAVERDWLEPTATRVAHEVDDNGVVRALSRDYYGALVLNERVVPADDAEAATLLARAYVARNVPERDQQLFRRMRFAGLTVDPAELVQRAAMGCRSLSEVDLQRDLAWNVRQDLDRLAPERLTVPSGRSHALDYQDDGTVVMSVKLQELFGLAETPAIGPRHEPILLALLAPNGRPVQLTRDLRSFWERTYPEVRKELRGRYPKHPWPDDPWTAAPTARTRRSGPS